MEDNNQFDPNTQPYTPDENQNQESVVPQETEVPIVPEVPTASEAPVVPEVSVTSETPVTPTEVPILPQSDQVAFQPEQPTSGSQQIPPQPTPGSQQIPSQPTPGSQQVPPQPTPQSQQVPPQYSYQSQQVPPLSNQPTPQYDPYTGNVVYNGENGMGQSNKNNGMSTAGLVLGIASIPLSCCWGIGIVAGIIGLILSLLSKPKGDPNAKYSGVAIGGIITSLAGILLGIIILMFSILALTNGDLDYYLY